MAEAVEEPVVEVISCISADIMAETFAEQAVDPLQPSMKILG
jgi:hypothetical protein